MLLGLPLLPSLGQLCFVVDFVALFEGDVVAVKELERDFGVFVAADACPRPVTPA